MDTKATVEALQKFLGSGSVSIVKFCYEKEESEADITNQGVLVLGLRKARDVIVASFIGVRNIEFQSGPYDDVVLGGLIIELVTDYQWPNVNVRVKSEMEDTTLSFYCTKVELQPESPSLS